VRVGVDSVFVQGYLLVTASLAHDGMWLKKCDARSLFFWCTKVKYVMHTCTDMVSTNHVIPQEGKDSIFRSIVIKVKIGRRHGKCHIVHIESTYDSPKVLKLKVGLLHVPHAPHRAKADGDHWQRDSRAARSMAACTFPRRVQAQIAWRDTQRKKIVRILIDDKMKASHESIILLAITREQASFLGRDRPALGPSTVPSTTPSAVPSTTPPSFIESTSAPFIASTSAVLIENTPGLAKM